MSNKEQITLNPPQVYSAIHSVTQYMGKGISKDRKNSFQGYAFRGIEDVLKALNPALVENNLVIIPRVIGSAIHEGTTRKGEPNFYTRLDVEFDIVSTLDGSKHTARVAGEAMDTGDKGHNKAMSVAYKYMAFMTFCIPTEGVQDDVENYSPEPAPQKPAPPAQQPKSTKKVDPPSKEDAEKEALRAAYLECLEVIKTNHNKHVTSAMAVKLCQAATGSTAPAALVKYLADLDTRIGTGDLSEAEQALLS